MVELCQHLRIEDNIPVEVYSNLFIVFLIYRRTCYCIDPKIVLFLSSYVNRFNFLVPVSLG